jgi:hypothetical protein
MFLQNVPLITSTNYMFLSDQKGGSFRIIEFELRTSQLDIQAPISFGGKMFGYQREKKFSGHSSTRST